MGCYMLLETDDIIVNLFVIFVMADMSAHFRNIHLQNLAEENEDLRRRISKLTQIQGYVQLLVDKLEKADRKEQMLNNQNGLLRQQAREFEIKFAQTENMHGDQMRYVFSQHDQLIEEKNQELNRLKTIADKEQNRGIQLQNDAKAQRQLSLQLQSELKSQRQIVIQLQSQFKGQRMHEQQLIAQYEQALIQYRNKTLQMQQDLQILYESLEGEKNQHLHTKQCWISEINQFKNVINEKQARITEHADQINTLSNLVQKYQMDNRMLADYNKKIQISFNSREDQNSLVINQLQQSVAAVSAELQRKTDDNLNLQTSNGALMKQIQDLKRIQAHLNNDNQTYITDNQRLIFLLEESDKENAYMRQKVRDLEDYSNRQVGNAKLQNLKLRQENSVLAKNNNERQTYLGTRLIELKQANAARSGLQLQLDKAKTEVVALSADLNELNKAYSSEKQLSIDLQIQNKSLKDANTLIKQQLDNVENQRKRLQKQNLDLSTENHNLNRLLSNPRELNKEYVEQIDKMLKNFHEQRDEQNKRHWIQKQKLKQMYEYELKQKQLQYLRQISMLKEQLNRNQKIQILAQRNINRFTPSKSKY